MLSRSTFVIYDLLTQHTSNTVSKDGAKLGIAEASMSRHGLEDWSEERAFARSDQKRRGHSQDQIGQKKEAFA